MAFKTPDVTPAQVIAIGAAVVGTAAAFGLTLSGVQEKVVLGDIALAAGLFFSDAHIRNGRARGNASKE